ncbi:MAG: hypothetical protein QXD62_00500 [Candidatus Woesearchaeota archaeon]
MNIKKIISYFVGIFTVGILIRIFILPLEEILSLSRTSFIYLMLGMILFSPAFGIFNGIILKRNNSLIFKIGIYLFLFAFIKRIEHLFFLGSFILSFIFESFLPRKNSISKRYGIFLFLIYSFLTMFILFYPNEYGRIFFQKIFSNQQEYEDSMNNIVGEILNYSDAFSFTYGFFYVLYLFFLLLPSMIFEKIFQKSSEKPFEKKKININLKPQEKIDEKGTEKKEISETQKTQTIEEQVENNQTTQENQEQEIDFDNINKIFKKYLNK